MHNVCGQWREENDVGCVCTLSPYHMSTLTSCYSNDYYGIYFQNRQTCSGLYSTAIKGSRWMPHLVYFQTQYNFSLPLFPHLQLSVLLFLLCFPPTFLYSPSKLLSSCVSSSCNTLCFCFLLSTYSFIFFKSFSSFWHISLKPLLPFFHLHLVFIHLWYLNIPSLPSPPTYLFSFFSYLSLLTLYSPSQLSVLLLLPQAAYSFLFSSSLISFFLSTYPFCFL